MNVALVLDSLHPAGAEHYSVALANTLAARGHAVTLAYTDRPGSSIKATVATGIRHIALPSRTAGALGDASFLMRAVPVLRRALRGVDLVHTTMPASAVAAWAVAWSFGIPVIYTPMCLSGIAGRVHKFLFTSGIARRAVAIFLASSRYYAHDLETNLAVPASRIRLCPLGVDTTRYVPEPPGRVRTGLTLGTFGRLEPHKGVHIAVEAVAQLDPALGVRLVIAGDGPEQASLEALAVRTAARTGGDASVVEFIGRVADVRPLLASLDLYLQTTESPNLGLSALEALASGVPLAIVARDPEERRMAEDTLAGTDAGDIVPADPAALAHWIEDFAARAAETLPAWRAVARHTAETCYDATRHVDCVEAVYHAIARPPHR